VELTTYPNLVPNLRIDGAIPPLLHLTLEGVFEFYEIVGAIMLIIVD
jgi:hypothetical protein